MKDTELAKLQNFGKLFPALRKLWRSRSNPRLQRRQTLDGSRPAGAPHPSRGSPRLGNAALRKAPGRPRTRAAAPRERRPGRRGTGRSLRRSRRVSSRNSSALGFPSESRARFGAHGPSPPRPLAIFYWLINIYWLIKNLLAEKNFTRIPRSYGKRHEGAPGRGAVGRAFGTLSGTLHSLRAHSQVRSQRSRLAPCVPASLRGASDLLLPVY